LTFPIFPINLNMDRQAVRDGLFSFCGKAVRCDMVDRTIQGKRQNTINLAANESVLITFESAHSLSLLNYGPGTVWMKLDDEAEIGGEDSTPIRANIAYEFNPLAGRLSKPTVYIVAEKGATVVVNQ